MTIRSPEELRWLAARVAMLGLTVTSCGGSAEPPVGLDGRVLTRDFSFSPSSFVVLAGQQTSILVENQDKVMHSFTLPALDISGDVEAGGSTRISFMFTDLSTLPEDRTVAFRCRFHGFEGMTGKIRVQP